MEKASKITSISNINNISLSTRYSEIFSYNPELTLAANLNYLCKKIARNLKLAQQWLLQQEIAQIIIDGITSKDDHFIYYTYYELKYLKKFVIKLLTTKEKLVFSIKNETHNWFKDNIDLCIAEIDLESMPLILAHAREITLFEYIPALNFLMGITVDKNGLIKTNGSNLFYSKPLIHMIHYSYQSSDLFKNFCETYNKEKLYANMFKSK